MLRVLLSLTLILGLCPTHFATAADGTSAFPTTSSSDAPGSEEDAKVSGSAPESSGTDDTSGLSPGGSGSSESSGGSGTTATDAEITPLELLSEHFLIKSVNPGFKVDDVAETGEAIELSNTATVSLPLSDVFLRYKNSSGTAYTLFEFPEGALAVGETIVLRYEKSPEVKEDTADYDVTYSKTLALSGSLELVYKGGESEQIFDTVCWTGKSGCFKFNSAAPNSLVRDLETREFSLVSDYAPTFSDGLFIPSGSSEEEITEEKESQCSGLEFSEVLSYYENSVAEQFVEIYNSTGAAIFLGGCSIKYKNKVYPLPEASVLSDGFFAYRPDGFTLTKNPNSENVVELLDVTGEVVASLAYPHGQKKGAAYALINGVWQITYYPTPGAANTLQAFRTCPIGKVINEATGNCVKATTVASVKPCPAGKYRNPETGRCKSVSSSSSEKKPCKEGYERNPETGRCRKIKSNDGADYALLPVTGEADKTSFIAIWALIGIGALGAGFAVFQFRKEINYKLKHLLAKFKRGK